MQFWRLWQPCWRASEPDGGYGISGQGLRFSGGRPMPVSGGVLVSLAGAILTWPTTSRRGFLISIFGLVIGVLVFGGPWYYWRTAQRLPAIHDITTDTENPPRFVSISPLRKNALNSSEYDGSEIAAKQRAAFRTKRGISEFASTSQSRSSPK